MQFAVAPISMTKPDWTQYQRLYREVCDESPTGGLDSHNMSLDAPAAFLSTLDFKNQPHSNMRNPNKSFGHVHIGFGIVCDRDFLINFIKYTDINTLIKEQGRLVFIIATGNMEQWRKYVVSACARNSNKDSRAMGSIIYQYLTRGGFKDLWYQYTIKTQSDKTIILERK